MNCKRWINYTEGAKMFGDLLLPTSLNSKNKKNKNKIERNNELYAKMK